jgi:hypothetical protein
MALSLINDVNVALKNNKQKQEEEKINFYLPS